MTDHPQSDDPLPPRLCPRCGAPLIIWAYSDSGAGTGCLNCGYVDHTDENATLPVMVPPGEESKG